MSQSLQYLLIVDDNAGVCRLLFELFSDEGYIVETARSGAEALRIIRARTPSLILLDVKMPGMSGLETMDKIKEIVPETPVVMMTAYTELDTVMAAREEGKIRYYLSKPFELDEMRLLVKKILSDRERKQKLSG